MQVTFFTQPCGRVSFPIVQPLRNQGHWYVYARSQFWFMERPFRDRRKPENRLQRATREAEILEDRLVEYWLQLGESALEPRAIRWLLLPAREAA